MRPAIKDTVGDEDGRANQSAALLFERISAYCTDREFDRTTIHVVKMLVSDHVCTARRDGIRFPDMVVLVLKGVRAFEIVRRDLDHKAIETTIRNLVAKYHEQGITPFEVANAIKEAFPDYRPHRPVPQAQRSATGRLIVQ